jgi:hypothetical protein
MGQISNPIVKGISVLPSDRESGPGAGSGATGNNAIFLGFNAGLNSAISNFIAIGNQTADGGVSDTTHLNGTTILGAQSAQALQLASALVPATNGGLTIIGSGNIPLLQKADSSVLIGQGNMPLVTTAAGSDLTNTVMIGNGILPSGTNANVQSSVIIGNQIFFSDINFTQSSNVVIGYNALHASTQSLGNSVYIGANVGATSGTTGNAGTSVIIGASADSGTASANNVVIGSAATSKSPSNGNNVCVGTNATAGNTVAAEAGGNVVLGAGARCPTTGTGGNNIIIGPFAGFSLPTLSGNNVVIEKNQSGGGAQKAIFFGDLPSGNVCLGNSLDGSTRDFGALNTATNILKLLNGTIGSANPTGGGYFYVTGGQLHWVDSGGNDTQLSSATTGQLASSINPYTNNAAANVGTLTNAPAVGNPTKWVPCNDNGTIRNVPMW